MISWRFKLVRDGATRILRFDLTFKPGFSKALPVGFELPTQGFGLSGNAELQTEGNLDLNLFFGVDLNKPQDVWMFQGTGIIGRLDAHAEDVAFTIGLGDPESGVFVGGRIVDGTLGLDGDFGFTLEDAALAGWGPNRRILITDLLADLGGSVDLSMDVKVDGNLPVYFPTESLYRGDIDVGGTLTASLADGIDVVGTVGPAHDQFIYVPDSILNVDLSQFSALDNLMLIIDGIDGFLGLLQDTFDGKLAGFTLPLIGDQLSEAADVIGTFRKDFVDGLRSAVETSANPDENYISRKLFELLHDKLDILANNDGNPEITTADIQLQTNVNEQGVAPEDVYMQWNLKLGSTLVDAGAGLDFELGIPGLGFETRGDINVTVAWELAFGFGIGINRGGFYIDVADVNELELDVKVDLPDVGLTGRLGFLQFDADDRGNTGLCATFGVDIRNDVNPRDNLIGIAELGSIGLDVGIAAKAEVGLGLELHLNSDLVPNAETVFPKIVGEFLLKWGIGDCDRGVLVGLSDIGNVIQRGLQVVEFRNIGLDLGSFLSDFVAPIVDQVNDFTKPVQPIIDVLTAPIPVISDLAGEPITLIDIADAFGYLPVKKGLIYAIADVVSLVNSIPDPDEVSSLILPYGHFTVYNSAQGTTPSLWDPKFSRSTVQLPTISKDDIRKAWDDLSTTPGSREETTKSFANGLADKSIVDFISFPIFDNPSQIFGLLMGNDASLIVIDLPPLDFSFSYFKFFPIFGPLGASITGRLGATIDPPAIGYDTLGLKEFFDSGFRDPSVLFDGLFLESTKPVVVLTGGLEAAAEINVVIARAGVSGGITLEIDFDLHDPNEDGKVRLQD